jgi:hypothetical protein
MPPVAATASVAVDHILKSWPEMFAPLARGERKHDVRRVTDRQFSIGDEILFREFDPATEEYTGRECRGEVTYITSADVPCPFYEQAINPDFAILSIRLLDD